MMSTAASAPAASTPAPPLQRATSDRSMRLKRTRSNANDAAAEASDTTPTVAPPALERRRSSRTRKTVLAGPIIDKDDDDDDDEAEDADAEMPPAQHASLPPVELTAAASLSSLEPTQSPPAIAAIESTTIVTIEEGAVASVVKRIESVTVAKQKKPRKKKQPLTYDASRYHPQALVSKYWIGAHVSAAGGVHFAIENAALIGARALALDLKSKRKWTAPPLTDEEAALFRAAMKDFKMDPEQILPHGSYLQNIGSPNEEVYQKSRANLLDELQRCRQMGLVRWNFHPGSSTGLITAEESMDKIAATLNWVHKETADAASATGGVVTVIENMASAGNVIGGTFEQLKYMIDRIEDKRRVGICIDTCHTFAAGYDLRTSDDVRAMLKQFDEVVGLKYLKGLHLNDSKCALGSKRDRHESIGVGHIGSDCFRTLMNTPALQGIPMILETPCDDLKQWVAKYAAEVSSLYAMEENALPDDRPAEARPPAYIPPSQEELDAKAAVHKEKLAAKRAAKKNASSQQDEEEEEGEDDEEEEALAKPKAARQPSRQRSNPDALQRRASSISRKAKAPATAAPEDESDERPPPAKRQKSASSTNKRKKKSAADSSDDD